MWFTTLLDKSKVTLSSHDAPRLFMKYPDLLMTADRSAVLGEQIGKQEFGALPHFQLNDIFMKTHSQEHLCHKILFWYWVF